MASWDTVNPLEESKIRLKLFIDKDSNKVVYAEAGKDFVDFLLHTFTKPLGLAMKEDFNNAVTGGLSNLYTSVVEDLSLNYMQSGSKTKAAFLNPNLLKTFYTRVNYGCSNMVVSEEYCLSAEKAVYKAPSFENTQIGDGYVKGEVTYMITDDLVVKPLSTSLIMELLHQLRITDFSKLTETVVDLGYAMGKELVKASLTSKTVLTDIFLQ